MFLLFVFSSGMYLCVVLCLCSSAPQRCDDDDDDDDAAAAAAATVTVAVVARTPPVNVWRRVYVCVCV